MFLGIDLFSGKYAMLPQPVTIKKLTDIALRDGTYDHLFLSSNPQKAIDHIYSDWEFATKINADYETSMDGGNTGFSLKNTDTILIKRREKGTMDWVTIFTIPVEKMSDFNFMREYCYARSDVDYDFMVISSIGGIQNSYEFAECRSSFEGICIADKSTFYKTIYNLESVDMTRNVHDSILTLLNDTYPVVVSNDAACYDSATVTACFLKVDGCDTATGYQAAKYRTEIIDWLSNKKAKILKLENGKVKLIRVVGTPQEIQDGHPELQKISFDFVEIGNPDSEMDLHKHNLSDAIPGRW